jgi:hypothetical protein
MKPRGTVTAVSANEVQPEVAQEAVDGGAEVVETDNHLDEVPGECETDGKLQILESSVADTTGLEGLLASSKESGSGQTEAKPEPNDDKQRLAELICQHNGYVGEREDGSYGVVVTIGEGYYGAVKEWAEADDLSIEEWLTNLVTSNIETYGQPARGR